MSESSTITVTSGPARGQVFEVGDELTHIGKGSENQVVVADPSLEDHQASIFFRNGRYAIYTPLEEAVEVDGNTIPAERWVWLPADVKIRLGQRTACQFTYATAGISRDTSDEPEIAESAAMPTNVRPKRAGAAADASAAPKAATLPPSEPQESKNKRTGSKGKRERGKRKARDVARFITDQDGDPLVQLGEDGHMPELMLDEGQTRKSAEGKKKQTNPLMLYAALACSIVMSLSMLFIEFEPVGASAADKARARRDVSQFYGTSAAELKPYQRMLRDARLAYSRNDRQAEREAYRQVLDLLNSEDRNRLIGVTGRLKSDEELKKMLSLLVSE